MNGLRDRINTFIADFQERWETQAGFRATWSTVGSAVTLILLCVCMLTISRVGTTLIFGTGNKGASTISGSISNTNATFPVPPATPINSAPPNPNNAKAVAPSGAATPTPTVPATAFAISTPTPSATAVTTPSATSTPGVFPGTASQSAWKAGQAGDFLVITTAPPVANGTLSISLDFGCGPQVKVPTITLDGTGKAANKGNFTVPACVSGAVTVKATFTLDGTPYTYQGLSATG